MNNLIASQFKQMLIVFYAIMFGHTAFALIAVFGLHAGAVPPSQDYDIFIYVSIAISIGATAAAYVYYRNKIAALQTEENTDIKFTGWRSAFIVKIALLEMPCLLNIVFLIVSNNKIFLYLYILFAIIMLLNKPTLYKLEEELQIGDTE